jgi:putative ABC transport system permease protein
MALGVYITFRILDFPDMTCDGSFALGGCVSAVLVVKAGWNPFATLIVAVIAGCISGAITAFLHNKCKIPAILAGILTMTGLYSINSRIMGQANIPFAKMDTVITLIKKIIPQSIQGITNFSAWLTLVIGFIFAIAVIIFMYWFFGTEIGCALRATGNNEDMVRALGESTDKMKMLGLVIGNGLVALSGSLVAQSDGYADIGKGVGMLVMGLASIVIGEVIMRNVKTFKFRLISILIGAVIYRIIIAVVLQLGLNTNDLKILTAVVIALALAIPKFVSKNPATSKAVVSSGEGDVSNVENK